MANPPTAKNMAMLIAALHKKVAGTIKQKVEKTTLISNLVFYCDP